MLCLGLVPSLGPHYIQALALVVFAMFVAEMVGLVLCVIRRDGRNIKTLAAGLAALVAIPVVHVLALFLFFPYA